jgi:hypothetical protein
LKAHSIPVYGINIVAAFRISLVNFATYAAATDSLVARASLSPPLSSRFSNFFHFHSTALLPLSPILLLPPLLLLWSSWFLLLLMLLLLLLMWLLVVVVVPLLPPTTTVAQLSPK